MGYKNKDVFSKILFILLIFSSPLYGEDEYESIHLTNAWNTVQSINNQNLWRAYLIDYPSYSELAGELTWIDNPEYLRRIYFDAAGNIRKLVWKGEWQDFHISYYNEDGGLCYMIYDSGFSEGTAFSYMIYESGDSDYSSFYVEMDGYNENDNWHGEFSYKQKWGNIPESINGFRINAFSHVDSLRTSFHHHLRMPEDAVKVRFTIQEDNPQILINHKKVDLYEQPDFNSKVTWTPQCRIYYGEVLKQEKKENHQDFGNNFWYKVIFSDVVNKIENEEKPVEGFIYGAFIEPQEEVLPTEWQLRYFGDPSDKTYPDKGKMAACRKSILEINKLTFKKFYITNDSTGTENSWKAWQGKEKAGKADIVRAVYIDSLQNIRKCIRKYNQPDLNYTITGYYDSSGQLINLLYNVYSYDTIYTYTDERKKEYDIKDRYEF
ncbi:MAG: hypothetical protein LUG18_03060 [Candidatus Azobacteroides sp.]|nr:hypothetical protein [Candidatus Azobacteroides sp.]